MVKTASRRRYVLVCRGPNCKAQGSTGVREKLAALIDAAKRDNPEVEVVVLPYTCFDRCGRGPNVVV
ncbi:MAG TPA: (2Fe-2S) ferredoxin domain-containing protein, partial [Chloroflexota bacterium]|nr:(2Fe-2S) ferredoxin domain-containing protein [Chloroflexota bacterium]